MKRTPKWLTKEQLKAIESFYTHAQAATKGLEERIEVDHIIPLQSTNVSGLHVPWNLQLLTKSENSAKRNWD